MTVENIGSVQTLTDLMNVSIRIDYEVPIRVFWPQSGRVRALEVHDIVSLEMCYNINNSVMVFRTEEAVFVVPYLKNFEEILISSGFTKKNMHVPFSNWDYPESLQEEWDTLVWKVREMRNIHF